MKRRELVMAWLWDHLFGGVPAQLAVWAVAPRLADRMESAANRRDGL